MDRKSVFARNCSKAPPAEHFQHSSGLAGWFEALTASRTCYGLGVSCYVSRNKNTKNDSLELAFKLFCKLLFIKIKSHLLGQEQDSVLLIWIKMYYCSCSTLDSSQ